MSNMAASNNEVMRVWFIGCVRKYSVMVINAGMFPDIVS